VWRYSALLQMAKQRRCSHVLTGHTATDVAETMVLNMARWGTRGAPAGAAGGGAPPPQLPTSVHAACQPRLCFPDTTAVAVVARAAGSATQVLSRRPPALPAAFGVDRL